MNCYSSEINVILFSYFRCINVFVKNQKMYHTYRCVLDIEEDVIRDIKIDASLSLQDLHKAIKNAFRFSSNEMAAFYHTNEKWEQGEEIPLVDMSDAGESSEMKDYRLSAVFGDAKDKLLYVYDFFNLWTFYIELEEIDDTTDTRTSVQMLFSKGELPHEAPDKQFESEGKENDLLKDFESEFNDEFDDDFDDDINIEDLEDLY